MDLSLSTLTFLFRHTFDRFRDVASEAFDHLAGYW
jgi:hypothetical protein